MSELEELPVRDVVRMGDGQRVTPFKIFTGEYPWKKLPSWYSQEAILKDGSRPSYSRPWNALSGDIGVSERSSLTDWAYYEFDREAGAEVFRQQIAELEQRVAERKERLLDLYRGSSKAAAS